jgi:outer membrane receptor protein involved in Fe transport
VKRTQEASGKFLDSESDSAGYLIGQEKLPAYGIVNALAGKQWRLRRKRSISAQLSVNNLLNARGITSTGFEQLRFDPVYPFRFANKYYYLPGLNFMVNTSLTF